MDHKAYLAQMSPQRKAALTQRSDLRGLIHLSGHVGLIGLLGVLIALRAPFWWMLLLPQGIAIAFLFTLQHEATHKTPFARDRLNEWVGWLTGLAIFQPFLWFRYFHLAHHRYTHDPERDPELNGLPKPESWASLAWHLSCVSYWFDKAALLWRNAFGEVEADYLPERIHGRLRREARLMVAIYGFAFALTVAVSPVLLWCWLVPLLLGFPVLRLYLLAEHGRCPHVFNMFDNTRTTYTNAVVRFLAWNMPYHVEHHAFPQVPFHRLPEFNAEIAGMATHTSSGYRTFARSYVAKFEP